MTDGRDGSYVGWVPGAGADEGGRFEGVDRALAETRAAVFPHHDLDPLGDL